MDMQRNLKEHLNYLPKETSATTYRDTIDILYKLHKYILDSPSPSNNTAIVRLDCGADYDFPRVWRYESVRLFLYNVGWRQEQNTLTLKNLENLQLAVNVLYHLKEFDYDSNKKITSNEIASINDDRNSQGFVSEDDSNEQEEIVEWDAHSHHVDPEPIITFASDTELVNKEMKKNKIISIFNGSERDYVIKNLKSDFSVDKNVPTISFSKSDAFSCCGSSFAVNPILNAAYIMQSALVAVTPLAGANFAKPVSLMSQICDSAKQLLSGGIIQSTGISTSGIQITSGPKNSFSISSPKFFGSAAIHIRSECNDTYFNLISESGPIETGIALSSTSDGDVVYSKNSCYSMIKNIYKTFK